MKTLRVAFFCSTPYQVLLAINIKYKMHYKENADIYILNHFKGASELVLRMKELSLFQNVKLVKCLHFTQTVSGNKASNYYYKLKAFANYKQLVIDFYEIDSIKYSEIYLSYPDVIIQLAIKDLYDRNYEMKVHLFEDGTGGYSPVIQNTTFIKNLFNKISGNHHIIDRYDSLLLFRPELYQGISYAPIRKLPDIDNKDKTLKKIINEAFDYKYEDNIYESTIFLEQPLNFVEGLDKKIKEIMDVILTEDYIIKIHPRSNSEIYTKQNVYKNHSIPWEVICLNNDIEDKILISYYSTVGISNKIVFDKEPVVVFLFDLKELKTIHEIPESTKEFIYRLKDNYRDKNRVIIPKNLEELKKSLGN